VPRPPLHLAGIALLLVPVAILVVFTVGETVGGDVSGLQHLLQAAPLVLLVAVAWRWPRAGGTAVLVTAVLLGTTYAIEWHPREMTVQAVVITELVLFAPPIAAGMLLLLASRRRAQPSR
jgi:hypothetical protein